MKNHPYQSLPDQRFWKRAVAGHHWSEVHFFPNPKFKIGMDDKIVTAGSCFAGNIGRYLKKSGLSIFEAEPAHPYMPPQYATSLGYGQFSARYGNIYTVRQLRELYARNYSPRSPFYPMSYSRYFMS